MLIDTHVHLEDKKFARDLDRVLARARDAAVERMAVIADDLATSRQAVELAKRFPHLSATVGIHPHHERRVKLAQWEPIEREIRRLAASPRVVAIGEIGIDHHYPDFRKEPQAELLLRQARIATDLKLPMVIHCRDAYPDLIQLFKREKSIASRGVVHCFSGNLDEARELLGLGFYLGVGGAITYPNAADLRETIRQVGLGRVVCETDAPYLPPQAKRGRRNEPSYMKFTVAELARLCGYTYQDVARITTANATRLYSLPSPTEGEIAYSLRKRLYLNVTNRCTNDCCFCERNSDYILYGHHLRLAGEPSAAEILAAIQEPERFEEFVICGLGEPTLRLDVVLDLAREMKRRGWRVRLNTNGHGNMIHGRNIAPELAGLIDAVAITMNAHEPKTYNAVSCPIDRAAPKDAHFNAMLEFARDAKKCIPDVRMKVVAMPEVDVEACRKIAEDDLKVRFQVRPYRPDGRPAPPRPEDKTGAATRRKAAPPRPLA